MPSLWILCGLSFSGKTTLARKLVESRAAAYVSLDAINEEQGAGHGGDGLPESVWAKTLEIAEGRIDGLLATGHDVVVDDTACYRWIRDRFRDVGRRREAQAVVVYVATPMAEIQRRRKAAAASGGRREITDVIFEAHVRGFEPPGHDETPEVLSNDAAIERWMRGQ